MDDPVSRYRLTVVGLDPGTELLRARVAERVAAMAKAGLVDEVRRLAERPCPDARQALGYKELLDAMEEGTPVPEALEAVVRGPGPTPAASWPGSAGTRGCDGVPFLPGRSASPGPWRRWGRIDGGVRQGARDRQRLRGRGGPGRPLPDHPRAGPRSATATSGSGRTA